MFRTITNKTDYIHAADVTKLPITYDGKMRVNLFGNEVLVERNEWLWHLHLKLTNACNAKCFFCVEQNSKCRENADHFVANVDAMLTEMEREGILYSVSLTGGEPLLFPLFGELCKVLNRHNIKFLTMNTNAMYLEQNLDLIDGLFDFVDISRHSLDDAKNRAIFKTNVPALSDLERIKFKMTKTKMRIQCVLCEECSIDYVLNFINGVRFADDVSFRKLMTLDESYGVNYRLEDDKYYQILEYMYNHYELKEQTVQDYYVYEIWNCDGIDVTFSYSNMAMVLGAEANEDERVCREFIIHPNGIVSGSWNPENKILKI